MTLSHFNQSLRNSQTALEFFGLFRMKGVKELNNDGVSPEFIRASLKDSYIDAYRIGLRNYDFDLLLKDQSFFQFQFSPKDNVIRYAFYQNPIEFITYSEYVKEQLEESNLPTDDTEWIGSSLYDDYEQYLNDKDLLSTIATLRYDHDILGYQPLVHSVSHLHVGHMTAMRIPIDKVITPLRFLLFIVKHVYLSTWSEMMQKRRVTVEYFLNLSRAGEVSLPTSNWITEEKIELHLI